MARKPASVAIDEQPQSPAADHPAMADPAPETPRGHARDAQVIAIAAMAHHAVRKWRIWNDESPEPPFDALPQIDRRAALERARAASTLTNEPDSHEHAMWLADMAVNGWRAGPYNPIAKSHPRIVPYSELPDWAQKEYRLYRAVVKALS